VPPPRLNAFSWFFATTVRSGNEHRDSRARFFTHVVCQCLVVQELGGQKRIAGVAIGWRFIEEDAIERIFKIPVLGFQKLRMQTGTRVRGPNPCQRERDRNTAGRNCGRCKVGDRVQPGDRLAQWPTEIEFDTAQDTLFQPVAATLQDLWSFAWEPGEFSFHCYNAF